MAYKRAGKAAGRAVGSRETRRATGLTEEQQIWLGLLVSFCLSRGTAVFIGTPTTTGSIRLNIYPPDDRCQGSLALLEDWSVEVPLLLSDVFEEEISVNDLLRAVPWAARKRSEGAGDARPALRPSEEVPLPLKPAQKATGG